jgi:hypothetical protein
MQAEQSAVVVIAEAFSSEAASFSFLAGVTLIRELAS